MNKNHKTVYNENTKSWNAVSELARGHSRSGMKTVLNKMAIMTVLTAMLVPGLVHPTDTIVTSDNHPVDNPTSGTVGYLDKQTVQSGGYTSGVTINSAGRQIINNDGNAIQTTISSGGWQDIYSGGSATGTTVYDGSIFTSSNLSHYNGIQTIYNGGKATSTTLNRGYQHISGGGNATGTTINSAGEQIIFSGGNATSTTINSAGRQIISNGGKATQTTISDGGEQIISSGGIASQTILNGGQLSQYTGGRLIDTTLNSGTLATNEDNTEGISLEGATTLKGNVTLQSTFLRIASGGQLTGTGNIGGNVVIENGATIGGQQIRTGNLTIDSGGTYHFTGYSDGSGDIIEVNGTATLNNGSLLMVAAGQGTWKANASYTILTATGGISGTFTTVSWNPAFLNYNVDYDDVRIVLTPFRNELSFNHVADTRNQKNIASGLESLGTGNELYDLIAGMSAEEARKAYDSFSGEIHGNLRSALLTNTRYARNAVLEHLDTGWLPREMASYKNLWADMWGHNGRLKGDGNAARTDNKGFGFLVGADLYHADREAAGLAIGYERTELETRSRRDSEADIDAYHLIGYGRTQLGPVHFKGGIGYSWLDIDTERNVSTGSVKGKNEADYHGQIAQVFLQAGHDIDLSGKAVLTPYAGLNWQWIRTDDFHEKGSADSAAARVNGESRNDSVGFASVGTKGKWSFDKKGHGIYGDVSWQHAIGNIRPDMVLHFTGGGNYNLRGNELDRDAMQLRFGADFAVRPDMTLSVGYDGLFGDTSVDHGGQVRLTVKF